MKLSNNAITVLERRYLIKDNKGKLCETVEQMFRRVADATSKPDKSYGENADISKTSDKFYNMMTNLEFLPNSPTLMNAGRPLGQLSACFVLPVEDSMEGIFESIKQAALIHKSGGGTGFSFSRLRPNGSAVDSTGGVASGPVSFMKVFNMATEAVKQGGTRRGANMGILKVDHPDIMEFIDCKKNNKEITNFNISVGLTEKFMQAAQDGSDYDLIDPHTKEIVGALNAKEVFDHIVDAAWRNGEPGIIFLDRLNQDNVVPKIGEIESTNPCGEQPLLPFESCNLGSINLTKMVKKENETFKIDYDKLEKTVEDAVHFLDNVIDANKYPLKQIEEQSKLTRKIGLGVMGFADMLLMLNIPYNSDKAVLLAEELMEFITNTGKQKSSELAKERSVFEAFEISTLNKKFPLRNATVTTIAPTGTLSLIANCSSGVEPVFGYVFIRNIMDNTEMIEVNTVLKEVLEDRGLYSEELMKKIAEKGSLSLIPEIPDDIKRVFVSAHEVSPEYHIRMQAAFQKYTDNAVSKTVNFSNDSTREDVAEVYRLAFELGCKGVTIYRDGSRDEQVLNIGSVKSASENSEKSNRLVPRPRPETTSGITEKIKIGCGNLYITVNYDSQGICEIFTNTGKAGGCPSQSEAAARLASLALRSGIDVYSIVEQLKGIRCPSTIRHIGLKCTSCPDAIARTIDKVYKHQVELGHWDDVREYNLGDSKSDNIWDAKKYCSECGYKLEHQGGCVICRNCGYSKCN